jgi:hypothetical protein
VTAAGLKFEMICWVEKMENITFNEPIIHNVGINKDLSAKKPWKWPVVVETCC